MEPKTTLIATLGGQPQKVTFLLDLLLARGEEIDQTSDHYSVTQLPLLLSNRFTLCIVYNRCVSV